MDGHYNYSVALTQLDPETTYYFRSYVTQRGQDIYGETKSFTTKDVLSLVETSAATAIGSTDAQLNAKLVLTDVIFQNIRYGFLWGMAENELILQEEVSGYSHLTEDTISVTLSGLSPYTQYYYKAYVKLDGRLFYGQVMTFSTAAVSIETIDLGLSVKWASCNLNAKTYESAGDYLAWGEIEPKDDYSWETYKWCMGDNTSLTKYCSNSNYGYNGFYDKKTVLDSEDDAAHVNLGKKWRLPTVTEFAELIDQCTWTWTELNGVSGYKVKSKINGNSIFLPITGYKDGASLKGRTTTGYYWTSSLTKSSKGAWRLTFNSSRISGDYISRYYGFPVRPVYGDYVSVSSVSLNKNDLTMNVDDTQVLVATIIPSNASNKDVTWSSSNPSVATVSSSGVVTAKDFGSSIITVRTNDGGQTATCTVSVLRPIPEIDYIWLNYSSLSMIVGDTMTLIAEVMPLEANDYYWGKVEFSSSDNSVVSVENNYNDYDEFMSCKLTAKKIGNATITAKIGNVKKTCYVTVPSAVRGLSLNKSYLVIRKGETFQMIAYVIPSNAEDNTVSWSVWPSSALEISADGVVTAKGQCSDGIITASAGNKTAKCSVYVKEGAVDLGLSVMWADYNLGIIGFTSGSAGEYYAWGEIMPGTTFNWSHYTRLSDGSIYTLKRYNYDSTFGVVDNKTSLKDYGYEDDAARQTLGGKWRIPTYAEWAELSKECTWERYNDGNREGMKVTGPNGNSIFLPAAGYQSGSTLKDCDRYGYYWTSDLSYSSDPIFSDNYKPYRAFYKRFSINSLNDSVNNLDRAHGLTIRPVLEK